MVTNTSISAITLNCQGLRNSSKRKVLFSWLSCFSPTLVCLQETHSTSSAEFDHWVRTETDNQNNKPRYLALSSPGSARSRGVAILYSPCLTICKSATDSDGRLQVVQFSHNSTVFQLVNLYGPNQRKSGTAFFSSIPPFLDMSLPSIVCGDFNTVVDPTIDRTGCNPSSPWAYNWPHTLASLTTTLDLVDVWRARHPDTRAFTWSRVGGQTASRLDMFWFSSSLVSSVRDISILPFFRSDHAYVFTTFSLPTSSKRGPGYWKLNSTLCRNADYTALIKTFWQDWQNEKIYYPSLSVWWDVGKDLIKQITQDFSRNLARELGSQYSALNDDLTHLHARQEKGEDVSIELSHVEDELYHHHLRRADGARLRARERWAEEGETSSRYFFQREQSHAIRHSFTSIRDAHGRIISSLAGILKVWMFFYTTLFTAAYLDTAEQHYFLSHILYQLTADESASCDGEVSLIECTAALNSFSAHKSPGIDGLPYAFYKTFWDILGPDLVCVLNSTLADGHLPLSQRTGIISLLYKKGDKQDVKNWRPITLLCTDYKILAKVLTTRLTTVIASVVSPCQTCGIPGRFSGEAIRFIQDALDYAEDSDLGGALLSLDQEKAFDCVDWSYMLLVLRRMNFGPSFCSWVHLLYTNLYSRMFVNGALGSPFTISRGVRQGCPLSPLLYVLVTEPLSRAIQASSSIDGFPLPSGDTIKILQYADDTTCFVMSDSSLHALFHLFSRYERATGAKLNLTKTEGLLFGTWKGRTDLQVDITWKTDSLIILGCQVGHKATPDWPRIIDHLRSAVSTWSSRSLSLQGRTLLTNTLGLSLFWYQATIFDLPKTAIHAINKIIFPFIWNKPREPIARSSAIAPRLRGGLGVVHVATKLLSLRTIWLRRLLLHRFTIPWPEFFHHHIFSIFHQDVPTFLARSNAPAYLVRKLPPFYRSIVTTWFTLQGRNEDGQWLVGPPDATPTPMTELTARKAYTVLLEKELVPHKAVGKFADMQISVHWPSVWHSLFLWRFIRSVADTNFYIFHGRLPTADRLVRFGMAVDPNCFCGEPESALHLFTQCPVASDVWTWLAPLFIPLNIHLPLSISQLLFGFPEASQTPPIVNAILGILRHHIWLHRNRCRFDHDVPHASLTLQKARSTIRFAVKMQHRHCLPIEFATRWLLNGLVGTIADDNTVSFAKHFMS